MERTLVGDYMLRGGDWTHNHLGQWGEARLWGTATGDSGGTWIMRNTPDLKCSSPARVLERERTGGGKKNLVIGDCKEVGKNVRASLFRNNKREG